MRLDPALAQQDRVQTLVQTPSSHPHGITAIVFFSGECRGSVTPPKPANLSYTEHRECGRVQVSVTPVPVFITTSPVESFSLKKLFYHQEENGEFKQKQYNAILLLQPCMWLSSSPSHVPQYLVGNTLCRNVK